MKFLKKLLALFLSLIMSMALFVPATAASKAPEEAKGINVSLEPETDINPIVEENSPELANLVAFAEGQATGYGSNGKFLAPIDPPDPNAIKIYTAQDLHNVRNLLSGSYVLMNDIELADFNNGQWVPIGDSSTNTLNAARRFTGVFDGQGYLIKNLTITGSKTDNNAFQFYGLFGYVYNATIKNVGLENTLIDLSITSTSTNIYAGGIFGSNGTGSLTTNHISINNCYNTGKISVSSSRSGFSAGGICGRNDGNPPSRISLSNCYNTGDVSSDNGSTCIRASLSEPYWPFALK